MIRAEQIINPVGLDLTIQDFQNYLADNLPEIQVVFGRAYKNENREGKFVPEVYLKNNEYFEIFANDKYHSFMFFDVSENRNVEKDNITTEISLICFANLNKIYSTLKHRATENLIVDIKNITDTYFSKYGKWELQNIIEGVKNVFSNYNYDLSEKLNNMQPFYICGFKFKVKYSNDLLC